MGHSQCYCTPSYGIWHFIMQWAKQRKYGIAANLTVPPQPTSSVYPHYLLSPAYKLVNIFPGLHWDHLIHLGPAEVKWINLLLCKPGFVGLIPSITLYQSSYKLRYAMPPGGHVFDRSYSFSYFCFVRFDSLRPIKNLSAKQKRVFLGWTSTKLE